MPLRTRAKGRARKAKVGASSSNLILHDDSVCRHGCDIVSKDDIRYKFVEQFEVEFNAVYDSPDVDNDIVVDCFLDAMRHLDKIEEFRLIREDDTTQKDLLPLFVCLATNLLLKYRQSKPYDLAMVVAVAAVYSQHNWDEYKVLTPERNRKLMRNLTDGLDYDVCRFFYKRSPCKCLKKEYSNTRSKPRYASCSHCGKGKERKYLLLCGGCMYHHFCSVECQKAAWPKHKVWCEPVTL